MTMSSLIGRSSWQYIKMNTEAKETVINGMIVEVVRKDVKNLHLGVYPPDGRVRVAAPLALSDDALRLAVIRRLGWIKRQQEKFKAQERQSEREMVSGESYFFLGRRYRLCVVEEKGPNRVVLRGPFIDMYVRPGTGPDKRRYMLQEWYREQMRSLIPPIVEKCEAELGVCVADWGIRRMNTKWGSCNISAQRIWLNLELAKKPIECLEYVIVHEMIHTLSNVATTIDSWSSWTSICRNGGRIGMSWTQLPWLTKDGIVET